MHGINVQQRSKMKDKKHGIYLILLCLTIHTPTHARNISKNGLLFIAIAQGKYKKAAHLLKLGADINATRDVDGNTPLMEAIKEIGQALIEIEASSVMGRLSEAGNLTDDVRVFFRKFFVSLMLAYFCNNTRQELNRQDDTNQPVLTLVKNLVNSFFPTVEQAAIMWCIYSFIDYAIAVGRHPADQNHLLEENTHHVNDLNQTIRMLLAKYNIDLNYKNYDGESALNLIQTYKKYLKHHSSKLILYQIEQILLDNGAHV